MSREGKKNDGRISSSPKRILIVKPSSLGDIVHSLPFLSVIRACFPRAEIHWVVAKGLEGLLEGHPMIDEIIIIDKDNWKKPARLLKTLRDVGNLLMAMRRRRYDMVIDLQGLLRSGVISMATGAPVRLGFSEAREGGGAFYTRKVRGGREIHAVDRYLKVAEALGCGPAEVFFPLPLVKRDEGRAGKAEAAGEEYVVIVPGARWDTKRWPPERFGKIASMLPLTSLVIGGGADRQIATDVVNASGGRAVSLAGETDLRDLLRIMRGAKLVVSNDSGPMHIAAGFNVPVVAIFGPTSPLRTGPYGIGHVVVESGVECSPCFKRRCHDMKCMQGITVGDVYERIMVLLNVSKTLSVT